MFLPKLLEIISHASSSVLCAQNIFGGPEIRFDEKELLYIKLLTAINLSILSLAFKNTVSDEFCTKNMYEFLQVIIK